MYCKVSWSAARSLYIDIKILFFDILQLFISIVVKTVTFQGFPFHKRVLPLVHVQCPIASSNAPKETPVLLCFVLFYITNNSCSSDCIGFTTINVPSITKSDISLVTLKRIVLFLDL